MHRCSMEDLVAIRFQRYLSHHPSAPLALLTFHLPQAQHLFVEVLFLPLSLLFFSAT